MNCLIQAKRKSRFSFEIDYEEGLDASLWKRAIMIMKETVLIDYYLEMKHLIWELGMG